VVGAYVEFFGDGAASLTIGDRATISNMPGIRRHRRHVLHRPADHRLPALTGREAEQVALVENYAKASGLWADSLAKREYERVLSSTCPAWCATWPARPTRTSACPPRHWPSAALRLTWPRPVPKKPKA
jgi:hypothetical protein